MRKTNHRARLSLFRYRRRRRRYLFLPEQWVIFGTLIDYRLHFGSYLSWWDYDGEQRWPH